MCNHPSTSLTSTPKPSCSIDLDQAEEERGEGGGFSAIELPYFVLLGAVAGLLSALGTDCIIRVIKCSKPHQV